MSYLVTNYSKWKNLSEAIGWDVVEKEPVAGTKHKVKVKYTTPNSSFKVKAVSDYDMVLADGTIDQNLPEAVVNFLKTHDGTDFAREYPLLANMAEFYKTYFFTYTVVKESDRRQVIVFTIQKRADFPNVQAGVKAVSSAQAAQSATTQDAKNLISVETQAAKTPVQAPAAPAQPAAQTDTQTSAADFKLTQPLSFESLKTLNQGSALFQIIDSAIEAMTKLPQIKGSPALEKSIDEVSAGKLGDGVILLLKGVIAGFNLQDKYGRLIKVVNQDLVDKLKLFYTVQEKKLNFNSKFFLGLDGKTIVEQDSTSAVPQGFNVDAFLSSGGVDTSTTQLSSEKPSSTESTQSAATPVINLVKNASLEITNLFKEGNDFWAPFKGTLDDDETAARDAYSEWYQTTILPKYLSRAKSLVSNLKAGSTESTVASNAINSLEAAHSQILKKILGNTSNDTVVWTIVDTVGIAKKYVVDTDF
jgi:hypothetical protein